MSKIELPTFKEIIALLAKPTPREVLSRIEKAHDFAAEAHGEKRRLSGELYIEHDRAVAHTVGSVGIDNFSTMAGLLHDVRDDILDNTKEQGRMRAEFGRDVTKLVMGLQKLEPYAALSGEEDARQLERVRRAILNVVDDDIRILLIRMADSLQDLMLAHKLPEELKIKVAKEGGEIYAPIANRLGIWSLKWQLEDTAFRLLKPEVHKELKKRMAERSADDDERVNQLGREIMGMLEEHNIKANVFGRSKHLVSIYKKMQRKNVPFEEIYDLRAVRVVIDSNDIGQCYQVLGLVHQRWHPIPEEFDDYIANPKPNGYKSLHTAVYDHEGNVLEVQIRTKAMDDDAERGIAAHWAYKEEGKPTPELKRRVEWLRHLLIDLRDEKPDNAPDEERMINVDDLSKRIYVFTPNGEVVELPEGGTPVDFAYRIHTEVGHRCQGATVNGKMVALNYQLSQGDRVKIITSKRAAPNRDWMSASAGYVKSGRTRAKVRQWFREHDREANIERGRNLLERELKRLNVGGYITIEEIARSFRHKNIDNFLAKVGFGDIQFTRIAGAIALLQDKKRQENQNGSERTEEYVPPISQESKKTA